MATKRNLTDLATLTTAQLDEVFRNGSTPNMDLLADWEFKGYNVPFFAVLLGIKKFKKGFYRQEGQDWGYNIPIRPSAIDKPWVCRPSDDNPKRFGFYSVKLATADGVENKEPGAFILNYKDGKNWLWEGSFLRDYLKKVDADNDDLYLGKAYTAIGSLRILPMYFILERDRKAPLPVAKR